MRNLPLPFPMNYLSTISTINNLVDTNQEHPLYVTVLTNAHQEDRVWILEESKARKIILTMV
jgi:hypothetical protein